MSVAISKVTRHFQITLPKYLRELAGIHEGDVVGFALDKNGHLSLTPMGPIDRDQAYYWTPAWQKAIRKSKQDYRRGRYKKFHSVKEARKHFGA